MPHPVAAFVLQGRSDFDALSGFNDELSRSLHALGIEPFIIDLPDWEQSLQTINHVLKTYDRRRIIGAFSFSGIGVELGEEQPEGSVWQNLKIPIVTWMMDHPSYILKRHTLDKSSVVRLYPTTDFVNFQRDYIKTPGRNIHCRMGAFTHGSEATRREISRGETPLIIFAKSLGNTAELQQRWDHLPLHLSGIIRDAIDHYWGQTERWNSVVGSVLTTGRARGIELENDLSLFCFLIAQVDQFFRMRKANLLVEELLKLPVRIYAKGTEHINTGAAKASLLPPISYRDLIGQYRQALAVVSMNPNSENDCHDRNYLAFGTGALPISDNNPWWEAHFPDLVPYSYNFHNRPITEAIEKVLAEPQAAADVAWEVGLKMRTERPFHTAVKEAVNWSLAQRYFEFDFVNPIDGYVR